MLDSLLSAGRGWVWGKGRRGTPMDEAPGTLIRHPDAQPTTIRVIAYGPETIEELENVAVADLPGLMERFTVVWIDVQGLQTVEMLEELGELLGAHRLNMEDVVNVPQRAKIEHHRNLLFITMREIRLIRDGGVNLEQASFFVGKGFVATFGETSVDCYGPVRERIRQSRGRIRHSGTDYLAFALIDAIIDGYSPVIDAYGVRLEAMENEVVTNRMAQSRDMISEIHAMKRDLVGLRRIAAPFRDAVTILARDGSPLIDEETLVYYRDLHDHTARAVDLIESFRELATGLTDFYLAMASHRLNDVMKVLTIISTIFIPLGFIAGLYGMNFDGEASAWNMPELRSPWGYRGTLGVMATLVVGLLFYFRRKRWL